MEDSSKDKDSSEELSFEDAYRQIEKIVATLESGRGELEEALDNYEKAVRLVKLCRSKLDAASQRIEMLKGLDADGAPILEKLDENELRSKADVAGRQSSPAPKIGDESDTLTREASSSRRKPSGATKTVTTRGLKSPDSSRSFPDADDLPPF
ncbi:MAG: exodeoxyribonuclease VII small subunit [Thermoguttaceae bacterium]|nr:exodeoxyribonuclease VII small subunit [Thermoguttaceae bacterium]